MLLKDVTPLGIGIKAIIRNVEGMMSTIVPRNSEIPITKTREYRTADDNVMEMDIEVFEGDNELADNNHMLGQFFLTGIPRAPKCAEPIDVVMAINEEGILDVTAT